MSHTSGAKLGPCPGLTPGANPGPCPGLMQPAASTGSSMAESWKPQVLSCLIEQVVLGSPLNLVVCSDTSLLFMTYVAHKVSSLIASTESTFSWWWLWHQTRLLPHGALFLTLNSAHADQHHDTISTISAMTPFPQSAPWHHFHNQCHDTIFTSAHDTIFTLLDNTAYLSWQQIRTSQARLKPKFPSRKYFCIDLSASPPTPPSPPTHNCSHPHTHPPSLPEPDTNSPTQPATPSPDAHTLPYPMPHTLPCPTSCHVYPHTLPYPTPHALPYPPPTSSQHALTPYPAIPYPHPLPYPTHLPMP